MQTYFTEAQRADPTLAASQEIIRKCEMSDSQFATLRMEVKI